MNFDQVEQKYSWTVKQDQRQIYIYWDNQNLVVDAPIYTGMAYYSFEMVQWDLLDQRVREALNAHDFKTTREAREPDRECPFNEANFMTKFNASYVPPPPR